MLSVVTGPPDCTQLLNELQWLVKDDRVPGQENYTRIFHHFSTYMAQVVGIDPHRYTRMHLSDRVNTMAADALATQVARASAAMVLT